MRSCACCAPPSAGRDQRKPRQPRRPGQSRHSNRRPRESSKEANADRNAAPSRGCDHRPDQATTGWQAHTCRGAFAGALKKKRGLTVTSEKRKAASASTGSPADGRTSTSARPREKPPERPRGLSVVTPDQARRASDSQRSLAIAARHEFVANALTLVQASSPAAQRRRCARISASPLSGRMEPKLGRVEPLHGSGVQVSDSV